MKLHIMQNVSGKIKSNSCYCKVIVDSDAN